MGLYLSSNNPEILTKYGFQKNSELIKKSINLDENENSYILFAEDKDNPGFPLIADDDYEQPMCMLIFRFIESKNRWNLYSDCVPCCSYHCDSYDMAVLEKAVSVLSKDGFIEWIDD